MKLRRFAVFFLALGSAFAEDCASLLPALERAATQQPQNVEALMNLVGDGLNLFRVGPSANDEVVSERCDSSQVQNTNVGGFFRLSRTNRQQPRRSG